MTDHTASLPLLLLSYSQFCPFFAFCKYIGLLLAFSSVIFIIDDENDLVGWGKNTCSVLFLSLRGPVTVHLGMRG